MSHRKVCVECEVWGAARSKYQRTRAAVIVTDAPGGSEEDFDV